MMSFTPSVAERLDRAVDLLMRGSASRGAAATAGIDGPRRSLVDAAAALHRSLPLPSVAPRFEARLGARLAMPGSGHDRHPVGWARRHPARLIVTGAVGSAVGVGVTAYAVWRSSRRATAPRFLHW